MKFTLSLLLALFLLGNQALAESQITVRRGVAFSIFSSIGGAVLGLSTLPFYDNPQDHTNNINIGALLGLLVGGGYMLRESIKTENRQISRGDFNMKPSQVFLLPEKVTVVWNF